MDKITFNSSNDEEKKIRKTKELPNDCIRMQSAKAKEYLYSMTSTDEDMVSNPSHYQSYCKDGIDCLTAMEHAFGKTCVAHFCIGNAFKYLWRHSSKGGMEDIDKAVFYLNKYKELNIIELGD